MILRKAVKTTVSISTAQTGQKLVVKFKKKEGDSVYSPVTSDNSNFNNNSKPAVTRSGRKKDEAGHINLKICGRQKGSGILKVASLLQTFESFGFIEGILRRETYNYNQFP